MTVFVPHKLKVWQPEHFRGPIERRCHWCIKPKQRVSTMLQVLEAPMRYHFCSEKCLHLWRQHRHDDGVVEWLRKCPGERDKILREIRDAGI